MKISPYLMMDGRGEEAIEFYKKAFGATERYRLPFPGPDGVERWVRRSGPAR